jgi:hypothetical protein
MRRYAVQLAAFASALIVGAGISVIWQNYASDVNSTPHLTPQYAHSADAGDVCKVHGERMSRRYVSILAGVPGYPISDSSYLAARKQLFPNSNLFIIDRNRAKAEGHAGVDTCSKCRAAERLWVENR